ncbi:MAG TPA: MBL fold metallo-hydrolase [Syntrophomonadaceae bacterium]|nr:MBL fold metallo-hydrolase [Syntrophomonadaceae bacterium]HPR93159.1 MBL fold metallo-hydrolase [Syntrophomonadaceae bacterium]
MQLNHISGQTYVINGSTQIGAYYFADQTCLLIDSGPAKEAGQVRQIIEEQGGRVSAIINTHSHADHCGGNREIQLYHKSLVYASELSAPLIQHPILQAVALFSASPPQILHNKYIMPPASKVDFVISPGPLTINGEIFRIIALEGHAIGHIGIETPDEVLFAGDSLLPLSALEEFPFLYLYDAASQMETLDFLKRKKHRKLYLSHGGHYDNLDKIIEANQATLENILQLITVFAADARTREEIAAFLIKELRLPFNQSQYYLLQSSISACLSYLSSTKSIRSFAADNVIKFQARRQAE